MLNYFRHGYDFLFAITKVIVVNKGCFQYCLFSFVLNVFKLFFFVFFLFFFFSFRLFMSLLVVTQINDV